MKVICQPVKPMLITQRFGDNRACKPIDGTQRTITCDGNNPPIGWMSLYGPGGHRAIDIATKHGQEVYAAQDGTVYKIDTNAQSGLDVRIEHEKHGMKFRTIYEHLMGYQPKVGDYVRCGQLIGWADNTGWSSGDHLHFVFQVFRDGKWVSADPLLYMEDTFAPDRLKQEDTLLTIKEKVAILLEHFATYIRK